jgi:flagellar motor component MotA
MVRLAVPIDHDPRRNQMIRFIVGVGLALAALLGAYLLEGGYPATLLGLSAFLVTFFVPLFAVFAVWSFRDWTQAWSHAFRRTGRDNGRVSIEIWKFSEFASYLAGVLASLTGAILILGAFGSAQITWNHALGAGLVGPLYGTVFGLIARILRAMVENLNP